VSPKPGFFIFDGERDHPLAVRIFDQVKHYCGMSDWEADLVATHPSRRENWKVADAPSAAYRHTIFVA
jgi:hypothetical protein